MAVLNLVHEILHSFGAEHDPAGIYIKLPIKINDTKQILIFIVVNENMRIFLFQINMEKGQKIMEAVI